MIRRMPVPGRRSRGFTLVDVTIALAVVGILASVALPSYQAQLARARRAEAIVGLTRVQAAQEQFRAHHGSYALRLEALRGVAARGANHELALLDARADGYVARARTVDSAAAGDCSELTLTVLDGVARSGPNERCWNR